MPTLSDFLATLAPSMTPMLVGRRRVMLENLAAMQDRCDAAGVRLRAHGKMHKCSRLGLEQVARGAAGLCCQTVGEAEAFAAAGIGDLLVTAPVAEWGWARLAAVAARGVRVAAVVDSARQLALAGAAAGAAGTVLGVVVDVDPGLGRAGLRHAEAPALVAQVLATAGVRYDGVQSYAGNLQHIGDRAARAEANSGVTSALADLISDLRQGGMAPPQVTGGGTGTHEFDLKAGVFSEIQAGSYALMDVEYGECDAPGGGEWPFQPALFVVSTVVSAQHPRHSTCDAGLKALSSDGPAAGLVGFEGVYRSMGDEHGAIIGPDRPQEGALVFLRPGHVDPTIALHDALFVADEDGTMERWAIDARRVTA